MSLLLVYHGRTKCLLTITLEGNINRLTGCYFVALTVFVLCKYRFGVKKLSTATEIEVFLFSYCCVGSRWRGQDWHPPLSASSLQKIDSNLIISSCLFEEIMVIMVETCFILGFFSCVRPP